VFAERAREGKAKDRIVTPEQVIAAAPEVIVGSWCGKKFRPEKVCARPGWQDVPAVARNRLHEVKSTLILQPGPAALTDGLDALEAALWFDRGLRA
jgi:iron complex transport system substrate-binding protein